MFVLSRATTRDKFPYGGKSQKPALDVCLSHGRFPISRCEVGAGLQLFPAGLACGQEVNTSPGRLLTVGLIALRTTASGSFYYQLQLVTATHPLV